MRPATSGVVLLLLLAGCGSNDANLFANDVDPDAGSQDVGDEEDLACQPGTFRCTGDDLEACRVDGSGYSKVITCPLPGLCDAEGGQCDVCHANRGQCTGTSTVALCDADGQGSKEASCPKERPHCRTFDEDEGDRCVECITNTDCTTEVGECYTVACTESGTCSKEALPQGTPCGPAGQGGECNDHGACVYCIPGTSKCEGNSRVVCDDDGTWKAPIACSGNQSLCFEGSCVECVTAADCPVPANECLAAQCLASNTCALSAKPSDAPCGNGGTCDGQGQCNMCTPGTATCNGNVPLNCGPDGNYVVGSACTGDTPTCENGTCIAPACYAIKLTSPSARIAVDQAGFGIAQSDFTVELWVKIHDEFTVESAEKTHIMMMNEGYSVNAFRVRYDPVAGAVVCNSYNGSCPCGPNTGNPELKSAVINDGEWHHVACVRSGNSVKVFTDGQLSGTDTINVSLSPSGTMSIGHASGYGDSVAPPALLGPMQISKTARYDGNFTPSKTRSVDGNTIAQWLTSSPLGSSLIDEAGGENGGSLHTGVIASEDSPCK